MSKKETVETLTRTFKKTSAHVSLIRTKITRKIENFHEEGQDVNEKLAENCRDGKIEGEDPAGAISFIVGHLKDVGDDIKSVDDCSIPFCLGCNTKGTCLTSTQCTKTENICLDSFGILDTCNSPEQPGDVKEPSSGGQIRSIKSRIPIAFIHRGKSTLGDRNITRSKIFLKRGTGVGFVSRKKFLENKDSACGHGGEALKKSVNFRSPTKTKASFLRLATKKDASNSTFVWREFAGKKCSEKAITNDSRSNIESKSEKKFPHNYSKTRKKKQAHSPSQLRKRWSETAVKTFEGMIFSSILAFSQELKESTENIHLKLQTFYDFLGKPTSVFSMKATAFSREWRQNNQDIFSSTSQEIAGIFRNLRKVESNLESVGQAISWLAEVPADKCFKSPNDLKTLQKSIK